MNLYELIKKNNYQGFSLSLIRRFANSLISCLRLLYRENIIHCDLKPVSNIKKRPHKFHVLFKLISRPCLICVVIVTGKRAVETTGEQLDQSHRFRLVVLQPPARLHVHTVEVLQESGSNSRSSLRHTDRYVELGLYLSRAIHGVSAVSGRGRDRTARLHYGSSWPATGAHYQSRFSSQALLR